MTLTTENTPNQVYLGDNLQVLSGIPDNSIRLIYVDPPFNTGKQQKRDSIEVTRSSEGTRRGFGGNTYTQKTKSSYSYEDSFSDYLAWLEPRLVEAWRVLQDDGTIYVHLDYREVHYVKVLMDTLFGRDKFLNEVVWSYDYGARSKKKWSTKHDNILVYVKNPKEYFFDIEQVDRIPYMAPSLVGPEKAARGKTPTDSWWNTIVSPNGKEKTGYPTQKPVKILKNIINASSKPGDIVLDFFAGSGSTGAAAHSLGRGYIMIDQNKQAFEVMKERTTKDLDPATRFIEVAS